ncbi:MAG: T9SS type A sorting domain-containing protein [Ignavibacteria bacterium]|nr:T9SS type A sorting domain-containing protein [Ignavibacteria bacterium]
MILKKLITAILILFSLQSAYSQGGWFYQNPLPQAKDIMSCAYINDNIIYAAAQGGVFLKSTNGGSNWNAKNFINPKNGMTYRSNSIWAQDENTIYILCNLYDGSNNYPFFVMKSTNAGQSWDSTFLSSNVANVVNFDKIKFVNQNTGYCYSTFAQRGGVSKTTNAGASWFKYTIPNTTAQLYSLYFINENTGWVSTEPGSYIVYKTVNGGANWTAYNIGRAFSYPCFINASTGWLMYDSVYKTTDGGISYTTLGLAPGVMYDYGFFNESSGWGIFYGMMYLTSNSGVSWNLFYTPNQSSQLGTAKFINPSTGVTMGENGIIAKTTNGGMNWSRYFDSGLSTGYVTDFSMADANSGWALGNFRLIKTTNGGNTWAKADTGRMYANAVFINASTGLAVTDNYFVRTTNGGASFTQYDYTGYSFRKACMPSANTWYIFAFTPSQKTILKTTNAGINWIEIGSPQVGFTDFCFVDVNTGFISAYTSIYKTTNAGSSWFQISAHMSETLFFINASTGWNIDNGNLYKTTDGGVNWQQQFLLQYSTVQNVQFINPNTGWIVSGQSQDNGRIFKTTDGGTTWNNNLDFAVGELASVCFINENTGWAGGYGGTILKTVTGGVRVNQINTSIPDEFSLSQNYPNPFNPSTKINYELKNTNYVSLKVFDLLGKEVASLVNEKQNAGSYAVDFNSADYNLPSGIYFYTLTAGDFKETRKLVLIK